MDYVLLGYVTSNATRANLKYVVQTKHKQSKYHWSQFAYNTWFYAGPSLWQYTFSLLAGEDDD